MILFGNDKTTMKKPWMYCCPVLAFLAFFVNESMAEAQSASSKPPLSPRGRGAWMKAPVRSPMRATLGLPTLGEPKEANEDQRGETAKAQKSQPKAEKMPMPKSATKVPVENLTEAPTVLPPVEQEAPIDLISALRLAESANPTIGRSRQFIEAALAQRLQARSLLLPTLRAGTNYHLHNGMLQTSYGEIRNTNSRSLYVGGGARTVAAETMALPMIQIYSPLTDAIFAPLAAQQLVSVRRSETNAVTNDILRQVAIAYFELIAAEARVKSLKLSEADMFKIVKTTADFATTGAGREADANRARTESLLLHTETQLAEEEVGVAAANLARLLNMDPAIRLRSPAQFPGMLHLIPLNADLNKLLETAVVQRWEVIALSQEIERKNIQVRQEKWRPILPSIWLGYSAGTFGGATNRTDIIPNPSLNNWNNFGGRSDFDVRLYWTLLNMGAGNRSLWQMRQRERDIATVQRTEMVNIVRREVASSFAAVQAQFQQVQIAKDRLARAKSGFEKDYRLARNNLVLPIEVINNMNRLVRARLDLIRATLSYNVAQMDLFVALGQPPIAGLAPPGE